MGGFGLLVLGGWFLVVCFSLIFLGYLIVLDMLVFEVMVLWFCG